LGGVVTVSVVIQRGGGDGFVNGFGAEAILVRCGAGGGYGVAEGVVGVGGYGLATGVGQVGDVAVAIVVVVPGGVGGEVFGEEQSADSTSSLHATAQVESPGENSCKFPSIHQKKELIVAEISLSKVSKNTARFKQFCSTAYFPN